MRAPFDRYVLKLFLAVSQKDSISVVKMSSSSRLLLKSQYPSPRGWVFRSKVSDMRSWSENEKGRMSVCVTRGVSCEEIKNLLMRV